MKKYVLFILVLLILTSIIIAQETENPQDLATPTETPQLIENFTITSFTPQKMKIGDIQFNIQIKNTGDTVLENLIPLISGEGFSSYDTTPIDSLNSGEKSYAFVTGHLSKGGLIILTIKISDKSFNQEINVEDTNNIDLAKQQEEKQKTLNELTTQFEELQNKYSELEKEVQEKKSKYDLWNINLNDLKNLLRQTQSNIISEDAEKAKISIILASEEYETQKSNLEKATKKLFLILIKENILLISTIAGSIITLITLYEIFRKKQEKLYKKIKEVKIGEDTKIIINKKKKE